MGLTHHERGNAVGARRLVERGASHLEAHEQAHGPAYGLDLAALVECARAHLEQTG